MLDVAGLSCNLPLTGLCREAHGRKQAEGRAQVLVLCEGEPFLDGARTGSAGEAVFVTVCGLEKIGHADLLHALACGFDAIHLQVCSLPSAILHQQQEVSLTRTLGGLGRIHIFDSAETLQRKLAAEVFPYPSVAPEVLAVGNRRDTARACAAALLPSSVKNVELDEQAPYGAVHLNKDLCNSCSSCVWVCPSDALRLTESGGELSFVESLCFQCGLCISVCPQRALSMEAGMDLSASAVLPHLLAGHAAENCEAEGGEEPHGDGAGGEAAAFVWTGG